MNFQLFLLFIILTAACWLAGAVMIGVWTYHDAGRRGLHNPYAWVCLTALVPFCVGILIYIIVKPAPLTVQCTYCKAIINRKQSGCPHCGAVGTEARPKLAPAPPQTKKLVAGYVFCCVGCAAFYITAMVRLFIWIFST